MTMQVSEKPWSDYKESDYTLEQWHKACLIHQHAAGADYTKGDCKLPVRTPDGVVNKNGMMAAAAALAGARSPMKASTEEKSKAAKTLARMYRKMEMDPPMSLVKMAGMMHSEELSAFLAHVATGNTTAIIAAIPAAMDSVRLIGDEDKHATLLFFGETSTLPADAKTTLVSTLEQVSKMMSPFRESVRDVARLGSDNPPALVAMLTNRNLGRIRDIMQVNPAVKGYLSNTTQYPSFTPHVTLGYPDYQGETELRDLAKGLYGVKFDKLALWWNDERIEFDLNDMLAVGESEDSMAMADDLVSDFLAHYGVPGMKWGLRRDSSGRRRLIKNTAIYHPDDRFSARVDKAIMSSTLKKIAKDLPEKERIAVLKLRSELHKTPMSKIHLDVATKHKQALLDDIEYSKNAVRTLESKASKMTSAQRNGSFIDDEISTFKDNISWANDRIKEVDVDIKKYSSSLSHSDVMNSEDDLISDFLAHHGIKGMKWGIRRANPSGGVDLSGVSRKDARSMKKDAAGTVRVHKTGDGKTILVQKQRDGSWKETHLSTDQQHLQEALGKPLHELSNQEVRDVVERQRLINSYNEMFAPKNNPQQGQGKSELQLKVEHLELQKRLADAQRALTPPKKDRVQSFTKKVSTGWKAFNAIDKTLNHNLSKGISRRLGIEPPLTIAQKLKAQNELLGLQRKNIEGTRELAKLMGTHEYSPILDAPSLAPTYTSRAHRPKIDLPSLAPDYPKPGKRSKRSGKHL